ncbi:MAG: alpha-L-arabinofuranosidase [Eubacteriales bacterium]|nr:alpha-L-arabinofuranosidase [Eubacteriales bacterium]
MHEGKLSIFTDRRTKPLGDLFGIFFEDLNHAADGGLYAELVQNRSFEFDALDNQAYHALFAWEAVGCGKLTIEDATPLNLCNTHYVRVCAQKAGDGLRNHGFGEGIPVREAAIYRFSCFARCEKATQLRVALVDIIGRHSYATSAITAQGDWQRYECVLTACATDPAGRLEIVLKEPGDVCLDMISLFPQDTFRGRENGLREDIARALADMKPKFLRFPGGCLVHDGTLDPEARDSMYRWKNTIGPIESRATRRSGWLYNQTMGLGFYEYFLLCEDIGAKPLPVLPGGCDPHHKRYVPMADLQPWIDDALDLIEFANGGMDTPWGVRRAMMGHPAPFGLEYIGIGNEEVAAPFFERLPYFVRAIREKYPEIKIIGTTGPFAAGSEWKRGWQAACENGVDIVDEHYYQSPEWFIANADRYLRYPEDGPKVFLGEYASWGNLYENALYEAAYMTRLQNAPRVALACYAPLLCHVDYVNWKPDMIWFDNHRLTLTPNYHVQRLFMRNQGDVLLHSVSEGLAAEKAMGQPPIQGLISLEANDTRMAVSDIVLESAQGERQYPDTVIEGQNRVTLDASNASFFTLTFRARRLSGEKGMRVFFGETDNDNCLIWGIGGWENQDCILDKRTRGRGSCLTQSEFTVVDQRDYALRLEVNGRRIRTYIDGVLFNDVEDTLPQPDWLYYTASLEEVTGEIIIKAVNVLPQEARVTIRLEGQGGGRLAGTVEEMSGYALTDANSLDEPERVKPKVSAFASDSPHFMYSFPACSVTIFKIKREG